MLTSTFNIPKVTVIGLGNLLVADEGFGVHVIKHLEHNQLLPKEVELVDGGTAGIFLAPYIEQRNYVIAIDTIQSEGEAGDIKIYDLRNLPSRGVQLAMSPHQIGLMEVLGFCDIQDKGPKHIELIGIIPADLSSSLMLSPTLAPKVEVVARLVCEKVAKVL